MTISAQDNMYIFTIKAYLDKKKAISRRKSEKKIKSSSQTSQLEIPTVPIDTGKAQAQLRHLLYSALCAKVDAINRLTLLNEISDLLRCCYMPQHIEPHKSNLIEFIEQALIDEKCKHYAVGLNLGINLAVQLGDDQDLVDSLMPLLYTNIKNEQLSIERRTHCCTLLGLLTFLENPAVNDITILMKSMEAIYSGGYGGGKRQKLKVIQMHITALNTWMLLCTLVPCSDFYVWMKAEIMFLPNFNDFMSLFKSPHRCVRMCAAEAIAVIFECGRAYKQNFWNKNIQPLIDVLKTQIKDSKTLKSEYTAYKAILQLIENNEKFQREITFGDEKLILNSWSAKIKYDMFSEVLGQGMVQHLKTNENLRHIFQLAQLPKDEPAIQPEAESQDPKDKEEDDKKPAVMKKRKNRRGPKRTKCKKILKQNVPLLEI